MSKCACRHRGGHGEPRIVTHQDGGVYCIICGERWVSASKLESGRKLAQDMQQIGDVSLRAWGRKLQEALSDE